MALPALVADFNADLATGASVVAVVAGGAVVAVVAGGAVVGGVAAWEAEAPDVSNPTTATPATNNPGNR